MKSRWYILLITVVLVTLCALAVNAAAPKDAAKKTTLTWYGQSFFIITSQSGTKIAFDPYHVQDAIHYSPPSVSADAVFVSHEHPDHNNVGLLKGKPKVLGPISRGTRSGTLEIGRSKFPYKSVFGYHDADEGKQRGTDTINIVTVDGVSICHLGDLGARLTAEQVKEIGPVDILLIPVGGYYTIDAATASEVVNQLKPKVVIPMHYQTPKTKLPISGVEPFIKGKNNAKNIGHTYTFNEKSLPTKTTILVMKYE